MGTRPRTARQLGSAGPSPGAARSAQMPREQPTAFSSDRSPITPLREHEIPVPPSTGRIVPARELSASEGSVGPRHLFLTQQGPSAGLPTAEHPPREAASEKT